MKKIDCLLIVLISVISVMLLASCNSCKSNKETAKKIAEPYMKISPNFNADSAYSYIEKQVSFGPRVPNSAAHLACGDYLVAKLRKFDADVTEQKADITNYAGEKMKMRNIIGSYNLENGRRILLFAHWDSRPFADEEKDPIKQKQPILGADDGASGVGVLLEIARQLQLKNINVGIDIIFFDVEDYGQPNFDQKIVQGDWWCLGSQYWSENPHKKNYKADFGILLDMVGSTGATFLKEGYSRQYAPKVVDKLWSVAAKLGYSQYFLGKNGGFITDDHVPVNEKLHIPSADVINMKETGTGFVSHWHTLSDDMSNIHKPTLNAVGQTLMEVIYLEN